MTDEEARRDGVAMGDYDACCRIVDALDWLALRRLQDALRAADAAEMVTLAHVSKELAAFAAQVRKPSAGLMTLIKGLTPELVARGDDLDWLLGSAISALGSARGKEGGLC